MLGINIDKKRIFGLDLLRAIAILCVVHGHSSHLLADSWLEPLISLPHPRGVDIFFVLSGYLIGGSFLSYAQKNQRVDIHKTLRFYARTALRILPNYYTILLAYLILVSNGIINGDTHAFPLWQFFTFTQNLFTPFYNFYWESWSLSVQWWFYVLFPMLLTIISMRVSPRKATPFICLFFILLSLGYRAAVASHASDIFWWDVWIRKTVASRCDCIYIGVLAAWLKTYAPEFWNRHAVKCLIAGIVLITLSFFIPPHIGTVYTDVFSLTIPPIAIALWFPFMVRIQSYSTAAGEVISHLSVLSYAMFLTNMLVVQIVDQHFSSAFHSIGAWGYGLYWLIVITISLLLYLAVEKPFVILRDKRIH